MAKPTDKRKLSLYFPETMLEEMRREADRQERSLSWIMQRAWQRAREQMGRFPSPNDMPGGMDDPRGRDE